MTQRITHTIQQRRTGFVGIVSLDGYKVAQQTCATEQDALAWAEAKKAEVQAEIRQ